jgi:hypothetical protein
MGDLREWSLNVEADMFEVSTFGSSGWKEFQPNLNGASGSVSGYWNVENSTTMGAMQSHLLSQSTDPATISLLVDDSGANGYTMSAWVTSLQPGASVDAIVPFTASITAHGQVSYSTTL